MDEEYSLSFQKMKNNMISLESRINELNIKMTDLKEENNHLKDKILTLSSKIQDYQKKEKLYLSSEDNLSSLKEKYKNLESIILSERNKYLLDLRIKDQVYEQDINQISIQQENMKHQINNFTDIKKLNDIMYLKNNELKKNIEELKTDEKKKLEKLEIKYNKKFDEYKKKMIEFLKKNQEEGLKLGSQVELNKKLNILHIQELINEIEFQRMDFENLLKERKELKIKILDLNNNIKIYKEVIDILTKKNHDFQNKLQTISKKIKGYNLDIEPYEGNNLIKNQEKKIINIFNFERQNQLIKDNIKIKSIKKEPNKNEMNIFQDLKLLREGKEKYKDLYKIYKNKYDSIIEKYSNLNNIFNEALDKIFKEDMDSKNKDNILIDVNKIKQLNFENMGPEQKYAILVKLINKISPFLYTKDLGNNLNIKEKFVNSFDGSNIRNKTLWIKDIKSNILNLKSNIQTCKTKNNCFYDIRNIFHNHQQKVKNKSLYHIKKTKLERQLFTNFNLLD